MSKSEKILHLMKGHHDLIEALFEEFQKGVEERKEVEDLLENFRWELQKHFLVEEEVVFRICDSLESNICEIIPKLNTDHDVMLSLLNRMEETLPNVKGKDVSKFERLLASHKKMEEESLYSELDKKLNKKQKEIMIARISGIPIKRR